MVMHREDFIGRIASLTKEIVPLPGQHGEVYVRVMTGAERETFDRLLWEHYERTGHNRLPHLRGIITCLCACDEQGGRLFHLNGQDPGTDDDLAMVEDMDGQDLITIFEVGRRLNGMTPEEAEVIQKNSETVPNAASGSDSP